MKTLLIISISGLMGWFVFNREVKSEGLNQQNIIEHMKLKIIFEDTELTATLYDNATTREFVSMLPITTELEDYASNEKIFYTERQLTSEGAPNGYNPSKGDITYYAPWGDVAIFYKDFGHANGLISLGKIDNEGIEKLRQVGEVPVTFELVQE